MSLRDDIENFIPEVEQHVRSFFEGHAAVIDKGVKLAEMADSDPLMQAAMAAVGLTGPARSAIAEALAKLDAEFQRVAEEATASGRAAGRAEVAPPEAPAEPEVPADGEQPAEVPSAE